MPEVHLFQLIKFDGLLFFFVFILYTEYLWDVGLKKQANWAFKSISHNILTFNCYNC